MITFSKLGKYGRLGNQMFQYAALVAIAKQNNFIVEIPRFGNQLVELFAIPCHYYTAPYGQLNKYIGDDRNFTYDLNILSIKDNTDIVGYFQSERNFENVKDKIVDHFFPRELYYMYAKDAFNTLSCAQETVGIHVRRSDYLHLKSCGFYSPNINYFMTALQHLTSSKETKILIFSDDIAWCQENFVGDFNFNFVHEENEFYKKNSSYIDFIMLSMCDSIIMSPSSFSWWAAFLGEKKGRTKKVLCPEKCFLEPLNDEFYLPERWTKIGGEWWK